MRRPEGNWHQGSDEGTNTLPLEPSILAKVPTERAPQITSSRGQSNEDSTGGNPGTLGLWRARAHGPSHQTLTRFTVCLPGHSKPSSGCSPDPVFVQGGCCLGGGGQGVVLQLLFTS